MTEKQIEQKFVDAVKAAGGAAPKWVSPGWSGVPDRIVLMPGNGHRCGCVGFVEVKAPGEKPRALQLRRHAQLRTLGFKVFVLDSPEQIPAIIQKIQEESSDEQ